jgi:hypothetical protein
MKDDKKKFVVLGILVVVMLAVGAFTFMGGGSGTPTVAANAASGGTDPVKVNADGSTGDTTTGSPVAGSSEEELPKNPLYAADLPQRDPFISSVPGATVNRGGSLPPSVPISRPVRRSNGSGSGYVPFQPLGGSLPAAGGSVTISSNGVDPNRFGYTVSGVITGGGKPAAVFTDASGNQRLVPVGGSLDGDSKVVSIDKGNVIIEHRGKTQRLSLGGNPK